MIKKQKRRRTLFLASCGLTAVLLVADIVLLCRSGDQTDGAAKTESICGCFEKSDKNCAYTFREDGSGDLRFSGGTPYKFCFTLSGRTSSIDYESESLSDCEHEVVHTDRGLS